LFHFCSETIGKYPLRMMRQTACKPGSVPALGRGMAIPLGRPSPSASRDRPGWRRGNSPGPARRRTGPAIPTWSCSRWGLPCRRRYRRRGALLPHPFTLAAAASRGSPRVGGLLSVALSLGSPPPGITRHRVSMEPGLSSPAPKTGGERPSGRLARPYIWANTASCQIYGERAAIWARTAMRSAVSASSSPSHRAGRQWRWKARRTARVSASSTPLVGTP